MKSILTILFLFTSWTFSQTDAGAAWTYSAFGTGSGGFYISNLGRKYNVSGTVEIQKIFTSFEVVGVDVNNTKELLNRVKVAPYHEANVWDGYRSVYYDRIIGIYTVGTQNYQMEVMVKLYRDARIELVISVSDQAGVYASYLKDVYIRTDYDLIGTTNLVEYTPSNIVDNPLYIAPTFESSVSYNPPSYYYEGGVEGRVYSRFFSGNLPTSQIYGFVKPLGAFNNPVTLYFMRYSTSYAMPPVLNAANAIQKAATVEGATYAYSGQDQIMWIDLKRGLSSTVINYGLQWKVCRKPSGRPVRFHWAIMQGLYNPFTNNDLANVKSSHTEPRCNGRNFNDAMKDMVGVNNSTNAINLTHSVTAGVYNPNPVVDYCANTKKLMTSAQLHSFMLGNRTITTEMQEDYTNWHFELGVVNAIWDHDHTAQGLLFDNFQSNFSIGTEVPPAPYREGAAIFAQNYQCGLLPGPGAKQEYVESYAHEFAHAIGMRHGWSRNYLGTTCKTIETGSNHSMRFSDLTTLRWFQYGPESLVKSGKYSVDWALGLEAKPSNFIRADGLSVTFQ